MINSLFSWLKQPRGEFGENAEGEAGDVAKKRLQFLLIHDRTHLPPVQMEALKNDLLEVLSRYVEVDKTQLEINLEQVPETRQMAIVSNVPVKRIINQSEGCLETS